MYFSNVADIEDGVHVSMKLFIVHGIAIDNIAFSMFAFLLIFAIFL